MSDRKSEADALASIGLSADGKALIDRLFRVLQDVAPIGTEGGALSELEGGRRLARSLIEQLSRDHPSDDRASTLSQSRAEPGAVRRSRGATRPVADAGEA